MYKGHCIVKHGRKHGQPRKESKRSTLDHMPLMTCHAGVHDLMHANHWDYWESVQFPSAYMPLVLHCRITASLEMIHTVVHMKCWDLFGQHLSPLGYAELAGRLSCSHTITHVLPNGDMIFF